MTPKEKATELFNKFNGKRLALTCLDEIQEHAQMIEGEYEGYSSTYQYFKVVRIEIESIVEETINGQAVSVVLKLRDSEQSHYLEKYLRESMFPGGEVISYANLPNTEKLYESSTTFKKLVKGVKDAQRLRDNYIHENN